jgi:hypothetical protein
MLILQIIIKVLFLCLCQISHNFPSLPNVDIELEPNTIKQLDESPLGFLKYNPNSDHHLIKKP